MSSSWFAGPALAMLAAATAASAQTTYEWSGVDCARSRIAAAPGATCRATNPYTGRDAAGGRGQRHLVRSDGQQGWSLIVVSEAIDAGAYVATRTPSMDYLKALDKRVIDGSEWSAGTIDGGIETYTFRSSEGEACAGFRKRGEARSTGHAWLMHGLLCAPNGQELPPAEISRFAGNAQLR